MPEGNAFDGSQKLCVPEEYKRDCGQVLRSLARLYCQIKRRVVACSDSGLRHPGTIRGNRKPLLPEAYSRVSVVGGLRTE
jgi:hypothetical protein